MNRLVVGRRGIETDPQLGEVGADDFIGDLGTADVRALIAHAIDFHEIGGSGDGDEVLN